MEQSVFIKKVRLFATIVAVTFAVLAVTLIIQFGFIAYNNTELARLKNENAVLEEQLKTATETADYYQTEQAKKDLQMTHATESTD